MASAPAAPAVRRALLAWYRAHSRDLPWRGRKDPYAVWVSEIMLQQTRVETVLPYYERWMRRFPTVQALARSSQEKVLAAWEGLGYYGRARNLHRTARRLVAEHAGMLPTTIEGLQRLPGIGRYTAAAIASIAFGADALALDGNLRRVLARLFDLKVDPRSPSGERLLVAKATELLPAGRASEFNQALMDLGARVCTPRAPACGECPLSVGCLALARGVQNQRPIRKPRKPIPHHTVSAAVLRRDGRVLICRRPEDKLLGGLWEFPGGKQEGGEALADCLRRELREELGIKAVVGARLGVFEHAYTHFTISVHAFECALPAGEPRALEHTRIAWVTPGDLGRYPMGKVDRRIATQVAAAAGVTSEPQAAPSQGSRRTAR